MELIVTILDKMPQLNKPQRKFIMALLHTIFLIPGCVNFRNLSRYSSYCEKSFSRNFAKPFPFSSFNQQIIFEPDKKSRQVALMDCSFVPKSGKCSYGIDYFHNGSAGVVQKGQEICLLAVGDVEQNTAFSLAVAQTPAASDLKSMQFKHLQPENPDEPSPQPVPTRIDFYINHLSKFRNLLDPSITSLAVDGAFSKFKFVNAACDMGLHVISKLRCDANLRYLYSGTQKERGRKRRYDGKVKPGDLSRFEYVAEIEPGIQIYTAVVNSISLERDIRLVVIVNNRNKNRTGYCLLYSTDTSQEALQILSDYKLRFQIEFIFRDAKQFTGLTDCQATAQEKLDFHFNAALTALNIARKMHLMTQPDAPFSMTSIKRQYFNEHFMKIIFSNLDVDPTSKKCLNVYQKLKTYGAIAA